MLGILRLGDLHSPSQAQADQGFFSAAASACGVFGREAGLSPVGGASAPHSFSSTSSEGATPSRRISTAGVKTALSTQTSMAAPSNRDRTAVSTGKRDAYTVSRACLRMQAKKPTPSASGVEGSSSKSTPHHAYGSELSTGGGRLLTAWSAMEPARHPLPVSSTAPHYRRIKSESQELSCDLPLSPPEATL